MFISKKCLGQCNVLFRMSGGTRKPFVNKDTGKFVLFFDNFSGYVYCNFRDVVKALGGLAWFGDHRATDIW